MTRLVVLAMLLEKAMHGYAIYERLKGGRYELWANVLPNSVYNALRKLERDGLIRVDSTVQQGNQTRVIYAVTGAGRAEFRRVLASALGTYNRCFPSELYVALSYLHHLPEEEVRAALTEYRKRIETEIELWNEGRRYKVEGTSFEGPMGALFDNGLAHLHADLEFVSYLEAELSGIRDLLTQRDG
ncbi:MAG: PadR family transcriptional regulator [Alkalispirochaeta sp.]